jgi:hypothetical protein
MSWYQGKNLRTSLRKHQMRVDLRVYPGDMTKMVNPNDQISALKSMLTSAIIKGLDVVGVVAPNSPQVGLLAQKIAKESGLDIYVLAGEDYTCSDKFNLVIYNLQEPMHLNLDVNKAIKYAHDRGGWVMAINVTKRQAQHLNKNKDTILAPDAIEIYNDVSGGYMDVEVEYPRFVSSASKSPNELEKSRTYTLIHRKDMEATGLLPEGEGSEFVPKYLERSEQNQMPSNIGSGEIINGS